MPLYDLRIDSADHVARSSNPHRMVVQVPQILVNVKSVSVKRISHPSTERMTLQFAAAQSNSNGRLAVGNLLTDATSQVNTRLTAIIAEVFYTADTSTAPHSAGTDVVGLRIHPLNGPWGEAAVVSLNAYPPTTLGKAPDYSASTDATGTATVVSDPQQLCVILKNDGGRHSCRPRPLARAVSRFLTWIPTALQLRMIVDDVYGGGDLQYTDALRHCAYI